MNLVSRLAAVVLALSTIPALADPPADALAKLGGTPKLAAGVVVEWNGDVSKFTDADWRTLAQCTHLKKLTVGGKGLTDATLPLLAGLTALEELSTNQSALSDDGYTAFAQFKNLKSLALFHPSWAAKDFTGAGLAHLAGLEKLERLTFAGSTAGDAALEAVAKLTRLKSFRTWHTAQTPAGNAHLLNLPDLRSLMLGQRLPHGPGAQPPSFDDSTLTDVVAKLKTLESLDLMEARLSAKGLLALKDLPHLTRLKITQCDVKPADIEALKAALSKTKIDFTPLTEADGEMLKKKLKL